jgi:MarR family transcriptional regulator, transcriptional regulator for hemolysin
LHLSPSTILLASFLNLDYVNDTVWFISINGMAIVCKVSLKSAGYAPVTAPGQSRLGYQQGSLLGVLRSFRPLEKVDSPALGFLLHEVARLLRRRFEQNARDSGLTRSQWQVLTYLARNEGINQKGLAELIEIEPITLGRIVDKLETLGLIERHPHPTDRRTWLLHLVEAARPKLEQIRKLGDVTHREALAGVSEDDGQRLLKTLEAMKANLTEASEAPIAGQKRASHG